MSSLTNPKPTIRRLASLSECDRLEKEYARNLMHARNRNPLSSWMPKSTQKGPYFPEAVLARRNAAARAREMAQSPQLSVWIPEDRLYSLVCRLRERYGKDNDNDNDSVETVPQQNPSATTSSE